MPWLRPSKAGAGGQAVFTPHDVADPGDDQLGRIRLGKVFGASLLMSSWKFPTSYHAPEGAQAF
ncbi:hypothetical protein [Aeromicrobium chenweiae]|uniref:hypothetical protein n=1 Tax=Aeromicrobium chenweiae TaxID=2079793 RepID=UPI0010922147|nr:hypothetical protein [Aeromicrobium chenweiae]TGN32984.1 hypothetical protein E4L97_09910 [Aeromicrobium chenweiae]